MSGKPLEVVVRVAGVADAGALASLRATWSPEFERQVADWLESEGSRRTTWLATLGGDAVGMASMFEYHRMPYPGRLASRWGYVSNMFVREDARRRGIASALLARLVAAARERGYARLVLSPSEVSLPLYFRAGFVVPDESAADDRLLVMPL